METTESLATNRVNQFVAYTVNVYLLRGVAGLVEKKIN
ncbi:hypothetical protein C427_0030 [Paraglaciecola psychrophila 170]|uniref:Uncharacterized protein n=1 Tax=Paraglaciecola psychrophila 170 TaxID=1129794 RepID=M4RUJ7_9ALTE|nr:hypothetical protein C427_0030 [Paraglaciecola psychrophila 170]